MPPNNPLVDPSSQFNPDNYFINVNQVASGNLSTLTARTRTATGCPAPD